MKVSETTIGASVKEILRIAGIDVADSDHRSVTDGGPYHAMAIEE